jgi:hypothetical protein
MRKQNWTLNSHRGSEDRNNALLNQPSLVLRDEQADIDPYSVSDDLVVGE